jgi:hypothetical protein
MQQNHGMFAQIVDHFVKVVTSVVDNSPAATPSRDTVDFRKSTCANDRSCGVQVTKRDKRTLWVIAQAMVDFISNKRNFVFIADSQDFKHMLFAPARTARV